jgi:hypothetical protein
MRSAARTPFPDFDLDGRKTEAATLTPGLKQMASSHLSLALAQSLTQINRCAAAIDQLRQLLRYQAMLNSRSNIDPNQPDLQ